jgi:aspartate 1-decarboxylase
MLNGPAARTGQVGDQLIILSYCEISDRETGLFKPMVVSVDDNNVLKRGG